MTWPSATQIRKNTFLRSLRRVFSLVLTSCGVVRQRWWRSQRIESINRHLEIVPEQVDITKCRDDTNCRGRRVDLALCRIDSSEQRLLAAGTPLRGRVISRMVCSCQSRYAYGFSVGCEDSCREGFREVSPSCRVRRCRGIPGMDAFSYRHGGRPLGRPEVLPWYLSLFDKLLLDARRRRHWRYASLLSGGGRVPPGTVAESPGGQ